MPNLNAALVCAQLENFDTMLARKKKLASEYELYFASRGIPVLKAPVETSPNHWMMGIVLSDRRERDVFLKESNGRGVMTRPVWNLLNRLPMYAKCYTGDLSQSEWFSDRIVNIPSSACR